MSDVSHFHFGRGILAGLVATAVLSAIMIMKQAMGLMPQLSPIAMISGMLHAPVAVGWVMHLMIGIILWGVLYAILSPLLPGRPWQRGAEFATGAWLVMMIMLMPMAGAGAFGLKIGMMAPIATLMLHWIYGAVLGGVFGGSPASAHHAA